MKASIQLILFFALFLPVSLLAQESYSRQELPFDKEHFKYLNSYMLELFTSNEEVSPLTTNFIFVTNGYGIPGISERTINEPFIIEELIERKNASSAELQENKVVNPGDELLNYFLENLNPETIISYRIVAKGKVQVKRYELSFDD